MNKGLKEIITNSAQETIELGKKMADKISSGQIICLSGDLGSGKTTFSQGFLRGLGVEGALTSPTFVVMKQYGLKDNTSNLKNVYHIDTYRVESEDVLNLGWEELINDKKNIILVEWPEKIKNIIPEGVIWLDFIWLDNDRRKISFSGDIF